MTTERRQCITPQIGSIYRSPAPAKPIDSLDDLFLTARDALAALAVVDGIIHCAGLRFSDEHFAPAFASMRGRGFSCNRALPRFRDAVRGVHGASAPLFGNDRVPSFLEHTVTLCCKTGDYLGQRWGGPGYLYADDNPDKLLAVGRSIHERLDAVRADWKFPPIDAMSLEVCLQQELEAAKTREESEGPKPWGVFHWKGTETRLTPKVCGILCFMWARKDCSEADLMDGAWGNEVTRSNLGKCISDCNRALLEAGCVGRALHRKSYRVFWE